MSSGKWPFDFPFQHEKSKKLQLRFNNTPTSIHHSNLLWEPNNMRFIKNINPKMSNFGELKFFSPMINFPVWVVKTHARPEETQRFQRVIFSIKWFSPLKWQWNSTFSWFSSSFWSGIESTNFIELIKSTLSKKAKDPGPKSGTKPYFAKHSWSSLLIDSQFWPKVWV